MPDQHEPEHPGPDHRLIVALDLDGTHEAERLVARLGPRVGFYKIGYQLAYRGGLELARDLARSGHKVFLDLKLHDIGSTVGHGVEAVAGLGATFVTVHAYPQVLRAAAEAARGSGLGILGVTVLTSLDGADLAEAGYGLGVADLVARRAGQAREAGIDGLVLSAAELGAVRPLANGMALVTPGIRPAGAALGDQKRAATPAEALAAGATHLVVGRPITGTPDPAEAAAAILDEMAQDPLSRVGEGQG